MRNKFLLAVMMLFMVMGSTLSAQSETGGESTAYAVYCEGNQTLYFLSSETAQNVGGTHNGQTITAVWSGTEVTETGYQPVWINDKPSSAESVVFEDSFKDVTPKNLYAWFMGFGNLSSVSGIKNFNTANVTYMSGMFNGCSSLTSLDLSGFNTANVENMASMFANCSSLTKLILGSSFNTANVTDMNYMFANCRNLNGLDLTSFNTANVTYMSSMFYRCSNLNGLNLSSFNTANVENMASMFAGCSSLTSLDLSGFNIAKVTRMASMFADCSSLTGLDLSSFNTANVENMASMFAGCSSLTSLDLSGFNTANVTGMSYMFYNCQKLEFILKGIDFIIKDGTSTNNMYYNCTSLLKPYVIYCKQDKSLHFTGNAKDLTEITFDGNTITLADGNYWKGDAVINTTEEPGWSTLCSDVSTVVFEENFKNIQPNSCGLWFAGFSNLKEIKGIKNLNTSIVTNMNMMFYGCSSLPSLDLSSFRTENVTNIKDMFNGCSSLTSLDIRNFYMFNMERFNGQDILKNCQNLEMLDLSNCTGYLKAFADFAYEGMEAHRRMIIKVPDDYETAEDLWRDENYMVTSAGTSFVRPFTEGKMSTVCLPFAVSASNEGGTFYRYDSYDGKDVLFKKVTEETTEPNTAYLFMPSATGKVTFTGNTALASLPADIAEGEETGLYGVYTKKTFTADDAAKNIYYGWAQGQFWRAGENASVKPNRAYLKLPAAAAARLSVRLDGNGTTGISTAGSSADGSTDAPVYNLQGQRVGSSYKGVVIKNGKKMIVK